MKNPVIKMPAELKGSRLAKPLHLLFSLLFLPFFAFPDEFAAAKDSPEPGQADTLELINITGSRILDKNHVDILPLTIFTGAELQDRGYVNLSDLVRDLTINTNASLDPYLHPTGIAAFDLRGLGVESTLTLLNGHRVAPVGLTDKGIDVSVIPVSVIERVEILKDGASALYGADAIAGVINIILKKDFYGGELDASVSRNSNGSSNEGSVSLAYGDYLTDDLGVSGYLYYSERDDYDYAESQWLQEADQRPNGDDFGIRFGTIHAQALLFDEFRIGVSPTCPTEPGGQYSVDREAVFFNPNDEFCRSKYYNPDHTILPKKEAFSTLWQFDYSLSLDTSWYLEASYYHSSNYKKFDQGRLTCCDAELGPVFGAVVVPEWHPDNPFEQNLELLWRPGEQNYWTETDMDNVRILTGLKGFAGQTQWEVSAYNATTDANRVFGHRLLKEELQMALFGQGGSSGDEFLNPFGGANSQELLDSIYTDAYYRSKYTDRGIEAYLTAPIWELNERPIELVLGAVYRYQEQAEGVSDDFANNRIMSLPGFQTTDRKRHISAVYAETVLPMFAHFDLQLAGRYEHYNDFGGQFSPKIAMRWQLNNQIMLRGSYTESFKAPNFDQLGNPEILSTNFVEDPLRCDDRPDNIDCNRPVQNIQRGNPDLSPHIGKSAALALVYGPQQISNLVFNLELWHFDVTDIVSGYTARFLLENLIDSDLIIRDPPSQEDIAAGLPGPINSIIFQPLNFNGQQTSGVDFSGVYHWQTRKNGDFNIKLESTYIDEFELE